MKMKRMVTVPIAALLCATLTGCPDKKTIIVGTTAALGTALVSLETIEGNPTKAAKLQKDFAAVTTAENAWVVGTPAQDVIQALTIVQSDVDLIPVNEKDQELIVLGIGLLNQILDELPGTKPAAIASAHTAKLSKPIKDKEDFKKRWNAIVAQHPELADAKVQ